MNIFSDLLREIGTEPVSNQAKEVDYNAVLENCATENSDGEQMPIEPAVIAEPVAEGESSTENIIENQICNYSGKLYRFIKHFT